MLTSPGNSLALAILEAGESPREFLKRVRPPKGWDRINGFDHIIGEYSLDAYGIEHNQYWQGVSTMHTRWDNVYVGTGDNPREAADEAIDEAGADGWNVDETVTNELPEEPSVADEVMSQCRAEARRRIPRDAYESDEDYEAAVDEAAEEDYSSGDFELSYYVVLWVRQMTPEDAEQPEEPEEAQEPPQPPPAPPGPVEDPNQLNLGLESLREAEPGRAKAFIKGLRKGLPSGWPVFNRWYRSSQPDLMQRRAFYHGRKWQGGNYVEVPKRLKKTKFLKLPTPGEYAVRYHATDVLYYDAQGNIRINTGGYRTNTTMARISQFAPAGWNIHRFRYNWYWWNVNWPEQIRNALWSDQRARRRPRSPYWIPVNDGDTILPDGTLKFAQGTATPTGEVNRQQDLPLGEGKYLDKLAWIKRVKAKHERMKEIKKRMKELEELDKPGNKKKYRW